VRALGNGPQYSAHRSSGAPEAPGLSFASFWLEVVPPSYSEARLHLLICFRWKRTITYAELGSSPGEPSSRGSFLASASVGAFFMTLPASYSVQRDGCATLSAPDGLMVSSTSAIASKPKPRFSPSRGFFFVGGIELLFIFPKNAALLFQPSVARETRPLA
jgi:hypothetical protein